jgi:phosphatidylserine decarboxylase
MNFLFILSQYLIPQHLLSRLVAKLADSEMPLIKNTFIEWFVRRYNVDMSEAAEPEPRNYPSFNAFFTRPLRAGARTVDMSPHTIACPADGAVSQAGSIENGRLFQAKGQWFSAQELLGGDATLAAEFAEGTFATVYLAPRDYHRVHMPVTGTLRQMIYVPGDLFSVNQTTAENVPRLFARNERLVCIFDTPCGPMAQVLVGAMIVAGIETVWSGQVAPLRRTVITQHYDRAPGTVQLDKGAEMGRFKLGSTVIMLFAKDAIRWSETLVAGSGPLRMGQPIGVLTAGDLTSS